MGRPIVTEVLDQRANLRSGQDDDRVVGEGRGPLPGPVSQYKHLLATRGAA